MDGDTKFYAGFVAVVIAIVFASLAVALLPGCAHFPRMSERVSIIQECGYPSNPHEARVFHECIEARNERLEHANP